LPSQHCRDVLIHHRRHVAEVGEQRLPSLRSGGAVDSGGINQQWRVDSTEDGYLITATASYASLGASRSDTLATILECR